MNDHPDIRVLVVDDSAFMRTALTRMIQAEADFQVVGTASCASDALAKIPMLDPDVVTLDVQMPGMDQLETLRHIMHRFPDRLSWSAPLLRKMQKSPSTLSVPGLWIMCPSRCHLHLWKSLTSGWT